MAHFAVLCPDNAGHLFPVGTLGSELTRRGHRVTVVGLAKSAPLAQQLGLEFHEFSADEILGPSHWLLWKAFCRFGAGSTIGMRTGFSRQAKVLLEALPPVLCDLMVDGLLIDQTFAGGGTLAEHLDLPYVTVCSAVPWNEEAAVPPPFTHWQFASGCRARWRNRAGYAAWHWYMRPVLEIINRQRRAWKLRPRKKIDEEFSPLAQILQLCPSIDFPRRELPACCHYTGPLAAIRPGSDHDFPWKRLDGRPMIFASLGTVPDPANRPVFRRILAACAGLEAQLILALGKWTQQDAPAGEQLDDLPGNALVVDFAPQLALLEKAALLITHAGINTVMEALSRAVPMVALPRSADQPGMGARLEYADVGLRVPFRNGTPDQLRHAIQRVLGEDTFRQRARILQADLAAAGGVQRAAEITEQALTGRPVLRR